MAAYLHRGSMNVEQDPEAFNNGDFRENLDDDGRPERTGKMDLGDRKCSYHRSHDWSRFAVSGMGHGSAGLDSWLRRSHGFLLHHLLHLHSSGGLLPIF
ncbi:hypothetical protein SLEP1_g30172 [Rubroshorea leprosula]|uniref:Uncharacterized protein n=1 Tax=Rubroshorea leprosula TaxID=152421 RepID=A0AAV5K503_9ROSI|nr:hypothetical protein SLEP1_g30172 [Rubroshorea leprosula]